MPVIKYKPWKISADSCASKPPPVCLVACEEGEKRQVSKKGIKDFLFINLPIAVPLLPTH